MGVMGSSADWGVEGGRQLSGLFVAALRCLTLAESGPGLQLPRSRSLERGENAHVCTHRHRHTHTHVSVCACVCVMNTCVSTHVYRCRACRCLTSPCCTGHVQTGFRLLVLLWELSGRQPTAGRPPLCAAAGEGPSPPGRLQG